MLRIEIVAQSQLMYRRLSMVNGKTFIIKIFIKKFISIVDSYYLPMNKFEVVSLLPLLPLPRPPPRNFPIKMRIYYFHYRSGHLVNLKGSNWKNLRAKLTPTFTSGKMKMMFPIMVDCGLQMQKFLLKYAESEEVIEFKEIFARFTTDIISSCAFGIETNCIGNPNAEFRNYGKKIFETSFFFVIRFILTSFFPSVRDFFGVSSTKVFNTKFLLEVGY